VWRGGEDSGQRSARPSGLKIVLVFGKILRMALSLFPISFHLSNILSKQEPKVQKVVLRLGLTVKAHSEGSEENDCN
jgi:hypothetical protein